MGSCSNEQHNGKYLEATAGELVWVRRGNGSWWPGQVMDVDQLPDASLDVHNSTGVPIKLLGRDDVTVDWYNLEKTTKVKAFRCGDHDSCIEKVKASLANPSKKRLRHACRERAIILALELETALSSKDCDNCSGADNFDMEQHGSWLKASPTKSHPTVVIGLNARSFKEKSNSAAELSHSGISFEGANAAGALSEGHLDKVRKQRTPNDSEDDGNEGVKKRMRGLDEVGVVSNTKELIGLVYESAPQDLPSVSYLPASNCLPTRHLANGSKGACITFFKKKRSKLLFQDILKRKNRRRMLTKVLQNDTLVSVPISFDELPSPCKRSYIDGKFSGLESNDSKSLLAATLRGKGSSYKSNRNGLSCRDAPLLNTSELSQDAALTCSKLKDCGISSTSELLGYDYTGNLFDVPLIWEAEFPDGYPLRLSSQLKSQNDSLEENLCANTPVVVGGQTNEAGQENGCTSSATTPSCNLAQKVERGPSEWQLKGRRNSRHQNRNSELDSRRSIEDPKDESKVDVSDPDNHPGRFSPSQHKPVPYRQSRFSAPLMYEPTELSVRNLYLNSVLYDVDIKVKASYRSQHVPYISLMSKLNGKPITGHPVTVEVMEDGECDIAVNIAESGGCELEDDYGNELAELTKNHLSKKPYFSQSKSPKNKKQGSSAKKTRRLSALTGSHGKLAGNYKERKLVVRSLKAPALACIPLKVVFSRITEALNGSSRANRVP